MSLTFVVVAFLVVRLVSTHGCLTTRLLFMYCSFSGLVSLVVVPSLLAIGCWCWLDYFTTVMGQATAACDVLYACGVVVGREWRDDETSGGSG